MEKQTILNIGILILLGVLMFWNAGMQQQIYNLEDKQIENLEYQATVNEADLQMLNTQLEINKILDDKLITIMENDAQRDILLEWLLTLHEEEFYKQTGKYYNDVEVD